MESDTAANAQSAADGAETAATAASIPAGPLAERRPVTVEQAGRTRTDAYSWLRDEGWQDVMKDPSTLDEDIRAYLVEENDYTTTHLEEPLAALTQELFEEMRARIKEDDESLPNVDGPFAYLVKFREGGEYPVYARRPAEALYEDEAENEILLDGDALGEGQSYFSFGAVDVSPDHRLAAYAVDENGSEIYEIRFRDLETGETLPQTVEGTAGSFVWSGASDAVYWVERDDNGRPVAVHRYDLERGESAEIYRESDPGFFTGVSLSESEDYIFITSNDHTTSEVRYFKSDAANPDPVLIAERETGIEYSADHWGDHFVIHTNEGGATDFKIMQAPVSSPGKENWEPLVPHQSGTLILGMDAVRGHLVRLQREDGLPAVIVRDRSGEEHAISFDEAAYDLSMSTDFGYDTDLIRFSYSSPATPDQEFDYNLVTRERTLRKTQEVPSGHEPSDYVVERVMAPARDGETVPVTLLRHKDTPVDGTAPLLLYGYGSYGNTISARFRTTPLTLADRGMIWGIAHIRGSQAKGRQWYLDGKLEKKVNTFNDYVDAGRHLVAEGYAADGRIVGQGGSAGGLLMGAVVNQAPELFSGIIAAVPFVDVLTTMSDETLPLTPPEWPEWGNPITSAEDYDTILSYSPIENVGDKPYPPMLITGGLTDPRVTYWEPAKWTAVLRHRAPEAGPYFMRINMEAGHGGASGRFEGLKETALEYAFALAAVGKADGLDLSDE